MNLEKDLYAYLWLNPHENNCNTYLIRGEVTVLIDPGHSRHVPNLFHQMEGELHLGKELFQIYQTPGHSPGSLSIHWPERKVLFTGDLVFYGGIGRTDFQGGNSKLIKESIERMSSLDTELLLPGHGEVVTGKEMVLQNFEFIRQNFYAYL